MSCFWLIVLKLFSWLIFVAYFRSIVLLNLRFTFLVNSYTGKEGFSIFLIIVHSNNEIGEIETARNMKNLLGEKGFGRLG